MDQADLPSNNKKEPRKEHHHNMEQEKDSKRDTGRPKRDQRMDALHAAETTIRPTAPKEEEEKEEHEP